MGFTYCSNSTECPLNGLVAAEHQTNSTHTPVDDYEKKVPFGNNYDLYLENEADRAQIAELYISLSAPCFDSSNTYYERMYLISNVYDAGTCSGSIEGVKTHQGYIDSGFGENERDVLYYNGILN